MQYANNPFQTWLCTLEVARWRSSEKQDEHTQQDHRLYERVCLWEFVDFKWMNNWQEWDMNLEEQLKTAERVYICVR